MRGTGQYVVQCPGRAHRLHPGRRLSVLHADPSRLPGPGTVPAGQAAATGVEGERRLEQRIPAGLSTAKARKFGLTVGPAFLVLSGVLLWRGRYPAATVTGSLGGLLILLALVAPRVLGPVERV